MTTGPVTLTSSVNQPPRVNRRRFAIAAIIMAGGVVGYADLQSYKESMRIEAKELLRKFVPFFLNLNNCNEKARPKKPYIYNPRSYLFFSGARELTVTNIYSAVWDADEARPAVKYFTVVADDLGYRNNWFMHQVFRPTRFRVDVKATCSGLTP